MRRSLLWVSFSILLTLGIAIVANLLMPTETLQSWGSDLAEPEVILAENWDADSAAEVGLSAKILEQSETLSYSSQAEVFRFSLDASGPYTLRYLTLNVFPEGLKPIMTWTVYPVKDDAVDFEDPVAVSEKYHGNLVRFRFSSSASAAYLGEPGEQEFAVVTSVLKDSSSEMEPRLTIGFPESLTTDWNWAWLPGQHSEAWLQLGESLGAEQVTGLPGTPVVKY